MLVNNNRFACHRYCDVNDTRYNNHEIDGKTCQRYTPNVHQYVCSICSVSGLYEQHLLLQHTNFNI